MTTLRELIDDAEIQIETYKHPNVAECQAKLSKVLEAAGLGNIERDYLSSIYNDGKSLHIYTEWSARGCDNNSSYQLPMFIIDAEDPIKAAKIWGLENKIRNCNQSLEKAKKDTIYYTEKLNKLQLELGETK